MISKRLSQRKKPGNPLGARIESSGTGQQGAADLELISTYRNRIEELENSLAAFRQHMGELNRSLAQLSLDRARFSQLFENTPSAYIVHDGAGYISGMNDAARKLLGLKTGRKVVCCIAEFLKDENLVLWLQHLRRCAAMHEPSAVVIRIQTRDGQMVEVDAVTSTSPTKLPHDSLLFYTLLFDLRPRLQGETALASAVKDYNQLINTVEGIVWEADSNGTFTFVSSYAERLLGFPVSEWDRPGFWENRIFVQDRERVLFEFRRALNEWKEIRLNYRVVAFDRRLVWLHDSVTVVERGGRPRLLGVAIDVTEQRNAEEQLRQAHFNLEQRVAERTAELRYTVSDLEAFSYSLSHDMRAPIRAMQGYAVLLKGLLGDNAGPQVFEFLERIMQSAERLDLLVQDVLKYSRLARAPIELKPVPLEPLVKNILCDYPVLVPPKAQVEIQQPLPVVYGHEAFVGQALSNLLTNAVKFVPKGKSPQVRLWTEEAHPGSDENGGWVRIWVEDNGLGIAPEDQKRIFRMFERVYPKEQYEGTGMGLAIVQKAVERMGGHVGVQSEPGAGSKFWIELKRA